MTSRYRLGAEELLELGRRSKDRGVGGRSPYLAGRLRMAQAEPEKVYVLDVLGNAAGWIAERLSLAIGTLGELANVPVSVLSQGVDVDSSAVAGILKNVPTVGDLLAQILVLGGSLIKFGLSVPGLALRGLANLTAGIAKALKENGSEGKVGGAKGDIVDQAPAELKTDVKAVLESSGVTSQDLTPHVDRTTGIPMPASAEDLAQETVAGSDIGTALAVGIPVAGAAALVSTVL